MASGFPIISFLVRLYSHLTTTGRSATMRTGSWA